MRIGIVCYPTFGGSGVLATELGKSLANNGHEIHFISYTQPVRLSVFTENIYYHEVSITNYPLFEFPPYILSLAGKLVDVVKYEKLDLLHVHYAIPHATAAIMARDMLAEEGINIPVITTLHGTDITLVGKDKVFQPLVSYAINHSDAVTAVSEWLRKETLSHFNIKKEIEVITNFVDLSRFDFKGKDHFKKAIAPNGERILIHASNFRKLKRVDLVIKIFYQVLQQVPSRLLLVGDGPERPMAEEMARALGIWNEVRFLGKQEAVEEILNVSDLFIMPSETESFGLAALEAMACKVPVLSSDAGGLPEVNIDGQTGYLLPYNDVNNMATKAIALLKNQDLLEKFKQNAWEHARKFDIELILPQYENLYHSVLANHRV